MPFVRTYNHRRTLPHIQREGKAVFLTFATDRRWHLPPIARDRVLESCLYENGRTIDLIAGVVMPDHVHLLFVPLRDGSGESYSLAEILDSLKSASAHKVNKVLDRRGTVWQEEYFDHVLRSSESLNAKAEYIWQNPVRKGLSASPEQYRWSYRKLS